MSKNKLSRRDLIKLGTIGVIGASLPTGLFARNGNYKRNKNPKNIIFMVADGMSMGALTLAESFSKMVRNKGTHWEEILKNNEYALGFFDMASLNSIVTDSAAASCSWATGVRINNYSVNMLPDGTKLKPIGVIAKEVGKSVGLVTTTRITHATPAGFVAVEENRSSENSIAPQYLNIADVLMGGGIRHFDENQRDDNKNIFQIYEENGYVYWNHRNDILSDSNPRKILGLFSNSHLPYTIDHMNNTRLKEAVPTLAEMSKKAIGILSQNSNGFLLQIEGGRVDHAAHDNDAGAIMHDQLAFDDAIGVAMDFARKDDETLVIITTDHGNANLGLNGMGTTYRDTNKVYENLLKFNASFETLEPNLKKVAENNGEVHDLIKTHFEITLNKEEAEAIALAAKGNLPPIWNRQHRNLKGLLGQVMANYCGVGWTGMSHTADYVVVSAIGPGQEKFSGLIKNTEVFAHMTEFMGVTVKNPEMGKDEAEKYPEIKEKIPHWI